ncbi:hypothetical protein [Ectobacillus polymachus]|uniref:hypothetical protein n=1 Tax=Ectobacillus polymachus TaxID=1508806 RepID=UPI003A85B036
MNYISGGYYIISPAKRSEHMDKDVLPDTIFSASECICDLQPQVEIIWGESSEHIQQNYLKKLNINKTTYEKMEKRMEDKIKTREFAYPQLFVSVGLIKEFYSTFLNHLSNLKIIGIGLPEMLQERREIFSKEVSLFKSFKGVARR